MTIASRVEPRHYNRFRYYDPSIARYISADPLGQSLLLLRPIRRRSSPVAGSIVGADTPDPLGDLPGSDVSGMLVDGRLVFDASDLPFKPPRGAVPNLAGPASLLASQARGSADQTLPPPLVLSGLANLYPYALNDPISISDPSGEHPLWVVVTAAVTLTAYASAWVYQAMHPADPRILPRGAPPGSLGPGLPGPRPLGPRGGPPAYVCPIGSTR